MYHSVRGMRDILPAEAVRWNYIAEQCASVFALYGYLPIHTPVIEETALFERSIGAGTDIVDKEMFTFADRKGRSLTLRPEGTAGIVRAVIEHRLVGQNETGRFYYQGPMYRYERPQKGRQREFHQIGAELIGADEPFADWEIMAVALDMLKRLEISAYTLSVNSVGCAQCRPSFVREFTGYLRHKRTDLCEDCQRRFTVNPLRILDCKTVHDAAYVRKGPRISDFLCGPCNDHFLSVKQLLDFSRTPFLEDPFQVRGLDYYTGTTFEIKAEALGAQDAVAAGGRYNELIGELGGAQIPAVGFAAGVERLAACIDEKYFKKREYGSRVYLAILGEESLPYGISIAQRLRSKEVGLLMESPRRSLKAHLRRANTLGCERVLIVGSREMEGRQVIVRNMASQKQDVVEQDELEGYLGGNSAKGCKP